MISSHYARFVITIQLILIVMASYAQAYFKTSPASNLLDQRLAEFSNGDLLIGNSSSEPLNTGNENGVLVLYRLDQCGNIIWSGEFNYSGGYLVLKDIAVNKNDEIFLYGSHYKGLAESVFIAKMQRGGPSDLDFRIFNPGSVDHFTYSIDLKNDELMVYGLLLDFNSSKEGFVGSFDHNLNFKKAIKFVPFESTGNAILENDESIIGRSGPYIYKFESNSQLTWAYLSEVDTDVQNIGGPHKVGTGWVYEVHVGNYSFLYLIDRDGELQWTSDLIEATNVGGDLSEMDNGNFLFVYNRENNTGTEICFMEIDPSGTTVEQKRLDHSYVMNTGAILQRLKGIDINVVGSRDLFSSGGADIENFIFQFALDEIEGDCYRFVDFDNTMTNDLNFNLSILSIEPEEFDLELLEQAKLSYANVDYQLDDLCLQTNDLVPFIEQKLLPCAEAWNVSLPNNSYSWDDGHPSIERELMAEGNYSARNDDCLDQRLLEFHLEKEECGCSIYLPNAFSPNKDENNDKLELGVFCDLEAIDISIYNKWGERVFESRSLDKFWNGTIRDTEAAPGIYSAMITYSWIDDSGVIQEDKIIQAITLLR